MTREQAETIAKETGLKVSRSPVGNVWGVRTPPEDGRSDGFFMSHPVQVVAYLAEKHNSELYQEDWR